MQLFIKHIMEVDFSEMINIKVKYPKNERKILKVMNDWVVETNAPAPNVCENQ